MELRHEEDSDEGTELSNSGGEAVSGCSDAGRKYLRWQNKRHGVRSELNEEVAQSEDRDEGNDHFGEDWDKTQGDERESHHDEPDELQATMSDPIHPRHGKEVSRHGEHHEEEKSERELSDERCRRIDVLQDRRQ